MHIQPSCFHALRRYLTPFYAFALGLAFILALSACGRNATVTPDDATATLSATQAQTASLALFGTQPHTKSSPTPLPAIPATPNERTPSPLGVTAGELSGLQINLWHPWTGATGASFQTILDQFNRTNPWGITVKARGFEGFGSLDEAVESALGSNALPDVLVDYGYQAQHWDESGILADLTPYTDDPVWGLSNDEQADFHHSFWMEDLATSGNKPKSRRLGVAYYRSAYLLLYNQSWARELGYSAPPSTPEDFRSQACAAAESIAKPRDKSNLGKGGWLITPEPAVLSGWIYAFGGSITNLDATGYLFNTTENRQAFTYLKGLQESGCAWVETAADAQAAFASRQALFLVGSLFDIPAQQAAFAQLSSSDEWVVIPFPSNKQPVVDTYGPSLLVVHSTSAKQLASWLVLKWLVYPPNQAEFVKVLGTYPTRISALSYLNQTGETSSQWAQALMLLPDARGEPTLASWSMMRWALSDASTQLFNLRLGADQIPSLIEDLDRVANEISSQVR